MAIPGKSQNLNRSNTFGTFPQTPDKQWINSSQNYFLTQDATGTPVTSPVAVSASADTVLTIPEGATELVIYSSTALRINDATPANAPYFVIPAATVFTLPCATPTNQPNTHSGLFYLRADASAAAVQFMFLCV